MRVCICVFGLSPSDCPFEEDRNTFYAFVAATGRPELVFFFVFKTSAGTSDEVDYGDCRHVCDDEESHHEDLEEGDHVHEVQYWVLRTVWSCFPFPLYNVFVFMLFFVFCGVIVFW